MKTASQLYAALRRFQDAYAAALRPLCERTGMAQGAVDILLFLANNPGLDTARDICLYRRLKPGIVSLHVESLAREGYQKNAVAYRCIRMIAEAAASAPLPRCTPPDRSTPLPEAGHERYPF